MENTLINLGLLAAAIITIIIANKAAAKKAIKEATQAAINEALKVADLERQLDLVKKDVKNLQDNESERKKAIEDALDKISQKIDQLHTRMTEHLQVFHTSKN
jgi:TolA-binding protein